MVINRKSYMVYRRASFLIMNNPKLSFQAFNVTLLFDTEYVING